MTEGENGEDQIFNISTKLNNFVQATTGEARAHGDHGFAGSDTVLHDPQPEDVGGVTAISDVMKPTGVTGSKKALGNRTLGRSASESWSWSTAKHFRTK